MKKKIAVLCSMILALLAVFIIPNTTKVVAGTTIPDSGTTTYDFTSSTVRTDYPIAYSGERAIVSDVTYSSSDSPVSITLHSDGDPYESDADDAKGISYNQGMYKGIYIAGENTQYNISVADGYRITGIKFNITAAGNYDNTKKYFDGVQYTNEYIVSTSLFDESKAGTNGAVVKANGNVCELTLNEQRNCESYTPASSARLTSFTVFQSSGSVITGLDSISVSYEAIPYGVVVAGKTVTAANKDDVLGDGKVSYVPATSSHCAILKLNGVNIRANDDAVLSGESTLKRGIIAVNETDELEINVTGNNVLYTGRFNCYDIYNSANKAKITLTGTGSLEAYHGFYMNGGDLYSKVNKYDGGIDNAGTVYYSSGTLIAYAKTKKKPGEGNFIKLNADAGVDLSSIYIKGADSPYSDQATYTGYFDNFDLLNAFPNSIPAEETPVNMVTVAPKTTVNVKVSFDKTDTKLNTSASTIDVTVKLLNGSQTVKTTTFGVPGYKVTGSTYTKNTETFKSNAVYSISNDDKDTFYKEIVETGLGYEYKANEITIANDTVSEVNLNDITMNHDVFRFTVPVTTYKVLGNRVTDENKDDILGDGSISYNTNSKQFTIHKNINVTTTESFISSETVTEKLSIIVEDTCSSIIVKASGSDILATNNDIEIILYGDLSIKCDGPFAYCKNFSLYTDHNDPFSLDVTLDRNEALSTSFIFISHEVTSIEAGNVTINTTNGYVFQGASSDAKFTVKLFSDEDDNYGEVKIDGDGKSSPLFTHSTLIDAGDGNVVIKSRGYGVFSGQFDSSIISAKKIDIEGSDTANSNGMLFTGERTELKASDDVTIKITKGMVGILNKVECKNLSIDAVTTAPVLVDESEINATGDVTIKAGNMAVALSSGKQFIIRGAKNVTITSNSNAPTTQGILDIVASGTVQLENKGNCFTIYNTSITSPDVVGPVRISSDKLIVKNNSTDYGTIYAALNYTGNELQIVNGAETAEPALYGNLTMQSSKAAIIAYGGNTLEALTKLYVKSSLNGAAYTQRALKFVSHNHTTTTKTTAATLTANGKIVKTCSTCGTTVSTTTIYKPTKFTISAASYVYDGKVKTPSVVVKASNGTTLVKNTDYSLSYSSGRKNIGSYTVAIVFKGKYSGTKKLYFTIVPKGTTISKLTATKGGFTVTLKKQATQTTGYQIQYSTSSKFTSPKTVTITKNTTLSKAVTKLTKGKKYYVRVRTYKKVGSTNYYSSWSAAKYVTTKK